VAIISRRQTTTYGELREQAARLRGGLAGLGVRPGDRVAIVAANNWYFVVTYLAVVGVGAVAVPLNPTSPTLELPRELDSVGARVLVVGPTASSAVKDIDRSSLPGLEHVVAARPEDVEGATALDELLAA